MNAPWRARVLGSQLAELLRRPGRLLTTDLALIGATWLTLQPLTSADVAALLAAHGEDVLPEEAAALHRRTEGNPLP
ncbi:hypothetical protein [Streptomyces fulvoviolaceus]|uniref:hypothetical protein n=2 Tax=Streptomyces fulvoviolaceus TaxID=285535 RepID=UPI0004C88C42|nr:hypothetical protein [Streptomyces fulvoviolaceus]